MTRFWIMELAGRKLVRLLPPSENFRGDPVDTDEFQPTKYTVDLMQPDFVAHPQLDGALVYEAILKPGDVLFIPEGWAHQALNLDWTLMISANYHDHHVLQTYMDADLPRNVCLNLSTMGSVFCLCLGTSMCMTTPESVHAILVQLS
jgi:hypothetical protein